LLGLQSVREGLPGAKKTYSLPKIRLKLGKKTPVGQDNCVLIAAKKSLAYKPGSFFYKTIFLEYYRFTQ